MDNNEIVSIIIPAYNAAEYITETVQSAMASSYPYLEIIIVNDGSTDDTQLIINQITTLHPEIKSFSQANQGVSVARNFAISKSNGNYILPLDADDLISPDYIEKAVEVLKKDEDVVLVYGEAKYFGKKTGKWKLPEFSLYKLARRNIIYVSGIYRKKDFLNTEGYCKQLKGREDWDFWISLLKKGGKVVKLDFTCFYYRITTNSKRARTKNLKKEIVDELNIRHKPFFYRLLNGKLHHQRTHSRKMNNFIHFFFPENIFVNQAYSLYEDLVYSANENPSVKETIMSENTYNVKFTNFSETHFHFPGTKLKNSIARDLFEQNPTNDNVIYLGYYEQQTSFFTLKSYLITLEKIV